MTNTERLIADLEHAKGQGLDSMEFYVGRHTGNGSGVLNALRRRGFTVTGTGTTGRYRVSGTAKPAV